LSNGDPCACSPLTEAGFPLESDTRLPDGRLSGIEIMKKESEE